MEEKMSRFCSKLPLDRGADPSWPEGEEAPQGFALHSAARAGNRGMVELLLDHGAEPATCGLFCTQGEESWTVTT